MNALKQTLLDKIQQLSEQEQQQVLAFINNLQTPQKLFDIDEWFAQIDEIHHTLRKNHGEAYHIDVQSLLDEVREDNS